MKKGGLITTLTLIILIVCGLEIAFLVKARISGTPKRTPIVKNAENEITKETSETTAPAQGVGKTAPSNNPSPKIIEVIPDATDTNGDSPAEFEFD